MSTIDDIDLHVRSYRSALKSSLEVAINSLSNYHLKMESILHPDGRNPQVVDFSALIYCLLRLPVEVDCTKLVLMGQSPEIFAEAGYPQLTTWKKVFSPARRRTRYFNPKTNILADFISSISDVDDVVNLLIAYQLEWNKFHSLLKAQYSTALQFKKAVKSGQIVSDFNFDSQDWSAFFIALGHHPYHRLRRLYTHRQDIRLRLLAGSWIDYTKTVQNWLKNVSSLLPPDLDISQRKIYFISSNSHSFLNLYTNFPSQIKNKLISLIKTDRPDLYQVWTQIQDQTNFLPPADFLSFVFRLYQKTHFQEEFTKFQQQLGLISIPSSGYLDVNVQIFSVANLLRHCDPRLTIHKRKNIQQSSSLIFNIDYPLGFAAYHTLNELFENANQIKGVYILGKAAVLNSEIGDIETPRFVFDEHTQNTYMFNNCFNTFFPFSNNQGSILTNQKAVSVLGTFLENEALLKKYMDNNFTVIEMESGPYLSAITEATYDQQLPRGTIVDLNQAPLDIGIINYTSDTPYSQAKNLGAGSLELNGVEPVYLGSLAILQRIIYQEEK